MYNDYKDVRKTLLFVQKDYHSIMLLEEQLLSRKEVAKRLNIGYTTVIKYEKYGWIPKAKRIPGLQEVFYTEKEYIDLVSKLKSYGKIK
jgi:transcriptional regulator with XRE-family HTH domain